MQYIKSFMCIIYIYHMKLLTFPKQQELNASGFFRTKALKGATTRETVGFSCQTGWWAKSILGVLKREDLCIYDFIYAHTWCLCAYLDIYIYTYVYMHYILDIYIYISCTYSVYITVPAWFLLNFCEKKFS